MSKLIPNDVQFSTLESETILGGGVNPPGTVIAFAGVNVPNGYSLCDGGDLDKRTYPKLFEAIGYTYGGSGNIFKKPDLRGCFLRMQDHSRGFDPNRQFGSYQKGSVAHNQFDDNSDKSDFFIVKNVGIGTMQYDSIPHDSYLPLREDQKIMWYSLDLLLKSIPGNNYYGIGSMMAPVHDVSNYTTPSLVGYPQHLGSFGNGNAGIGITRPHNVSMNYIIKL